MVPGQIEIHDPDVILPSSKFGDFTCSLLTMVRFIGLDNNGIPMPSDTEFEDFECNEYNFWKW